MNYVCKEESTDTLSCGPEQGQTKKQTFFITVTGIVEGVIIDLARV